MPVGVLGFSTFGSKGMESMHISQALADEEGQPAERRVSSTLAHEAGHGLMHAHLFVLADERATLFGPNQDVDGPKVLCRDEKHASRSYDGRWWELQANMAIGPLLMPRKLVHEALGPYLVKRGTFGAEEIDPARREEAVRSLAASFEVNPAVARIRVDKIYKPLGNQLTL
jgi:Zn-dependent peptidase ImmA (M78 family)